jgi:hypothetical protein
MLDLKLIINLLILFKAIPSYLVHWYQCFDFCFQSMTHRFACQTLIPSHPAKFSLKRFVLRLFSFHLKLVQFINKVNKTIRPNFMNFGNTPRTRFLIDLNDATFIIEAGQWLVARASCRAQNFVPLQSCQIVLNRYSSN